MLKNYATFLGLDPEPLLLQFAEGLQARLAVRQATLTPARRPGEVQIPRRPSALRRLLTGDLFIGALLVIFMTGFMIWGAIRVFAIRSEQKPPVTPPPVGQFLASTQAVTSTPATATASAAALAEETQAGQAQGSETQAGEAPTTEAPVDEGETNGQVTEPASPSGVVQVYVTVRQRAWMRVTVDGEVEFEGRVIPGSAYQFAGNEQVEILTGNAAALQIFFNQQDLGPLGQFGEVVQRVFTPLGIQTPTPTITPTETPTPRPSPTSEGTPTLRPFVTATP
jgi:cytoskeletal protein RodZ